MKIDFIICFLKGGGAERVLTILANHFSKKDVQISIITLNEGDAYKLDNSIDRVRLHGGRFKNHTIRTTNNLRMYYKKKEKRPDCIISFLTRENMSSILIGKYYNIPVIVCEHINHLQKGNFMDFLGKKFLYRFADQVTVLTNYDVAYYQAKGAQVTVMPNPCTFQKINLPINSRKNTILAVGSLDRYHHKGFDNLLTICKEIFNFFPNWKLRIVGQGNNGLQYLTEIVKKNGLNNYVEFMGFRSDVDQLMQQASIFVLSSRFEGLPMVLLEAMSQGMACIAYDCITGPSDMIQHEENGLLIEDQNKEAMVEGIKTLIENEALRKKLGKNAVASIDNYSIENIAAKWFDLFKKLGIT